MQTHNLVSTFLESLVLFKIQKRQAPMAGFNILVVYFFIFNNGKGGGGFPRFSQSTNKQVTGFVNDAY